MKLYVYNGEPESSFDIKFCALLIAFVIFVGVFATILFKEYQCNQKDGVYIRQIITSFCIKKEIIK